MGGKAYSSKCVIMLYAIKVPDDDHCSAYSASNALNKWLKANFLDDKVIHALGPANRNRPRAVQCPAEMIDQISGWSSNKIGESYGEGSKTINTKSYIERITLSMYSACDISSSPVVLW